MANVSDSALKYDNMSSTEIISEMMAMMKVLSKKDKKLETTVTKTEEKKAKAAPSKGVVPVQFLKPSAWVDFVLDHVLANGWESFVHAERCGKGMVDTEYPPSVLVPMLDAEGKEMMDEDDDALMIHIFEGSANEQPTKQHAMSLSKLYRTTMPELYAEFEAQYEEPPAVEGTVAVKPVAPRVSMTLLERRAMQAAAKAEKEAEKEAAKALRAQKKAEKEAEKEAEKLRKAAEKAAKAAAKAPKAAVLRAVVPVKAVAAAAKPVVAAKVAVAAKLVAKVAAAWVRPPKGQSRAFEFDGVTYRRDHLDRLWTNEEESELVGTFIEETQFINRNIDEAPEDDE